MEEGEEESENKKMEKSKSSSDSKGKSKKDNKAEESGETDASSTEQEAADPTSEEVYQYNLYYYGQEYADAYRDYYLEHPDAEAMPDFVAESKADAEQKKQDNSKKGKKRAGDQDNKPKEPKKEEGMFVTITPHVCSYLLFVINLYFLPKVKKNLYQMKI